MQQLNEQHFITDFVKKVFTAILGDRNRALERAMEKDPEFQKAATRVLGDAPIYTGEQATRVMSNAATRAKASRGWLREWLHKGWGLEFES